MTQEPEVHVTIDPAGGVEVEVFGVQGPACTALARPYEELFAAAEVRKKDEYHQHVAATVRQQQKL